MVQRNRKLAWLKRLLAICAASFIGAQSIWIPAQETENLDSKFEELQARFSVLGQEAKLSQPDPNAEFVDDNDIDFKPPVSKKRKHRPTSVLAPPINGSTSESVEQFQDLPPVKKLSQPDPNAEFVDDNRIDFKPPISRNQEHRPISVLAAPINGSTSESVEQFQD